MGGVNMWQSRKWLKTQLESYRKEYNRLIEENNRCRREITDLKYKLSQESPELKEARQKIQELECLKRYWNVTSIDALKASEEEARQLGNFLAIMGYKGTLVKERSNFDTSYVAYHKKETLEIR